MKNASGSQETIIGTETIIGGIDTNIGAGSGGAPIKVVDRVGRHEGIGGA